MISLISRSLIMLIFVIFSHQYTSSTVIFPYTGREDTFLQNTFGKGIPYSDWNHNFILDRNNLIKCIHHMVDKYINNNDIYSLSKLYENLRTMLIDELTTSVYGIDEIEQFCIRHDLKSKYIEYEKYTFGYDVDIDSVNIITNICSDIAYSITDKQYEWFDFNSFKKEIIDCFRQSIEKMVYLIENHKLNLDISMEES